MKTVPILIIDKDGNSVELEINRYQYVSLGISKADVKLYTKKSDLNKIVTEFVKRNKGDDNE